MTDNVIPMKDIGSDEPHFVVQALCVPCTHRWIGVAHHEANLFKLECPSCGAKESFTSILPHDYLDVVVSDQEKH